MIGEFSQSALIGRDRYSAMLAELLDRAVAGNGSVLILRGQAGIGKSALLGAIRTMATDQHLTVVSAAGVENEAGLPFAALHQLLRPLEAEVSKLPVAQQRTLRAAFGQADGSPDLYAVALATLQLVGEAAAVCPTVLLVDDLQWIDSCSADVLSFVARRIGSDAVLVLGATRTGSEDAARRAGLPEVLVEPLDEQSAAALLQAQAPTLPSTVRQRLLSQAAGNPLALTELPRAMRQTTDRMVDDLPLTARLETAFAARSAELSEPTRTLLVVLAADVGCDAGRLLRAASTLAGVPVGAAHLQEAIDVGLVEMAGPLLRFRHPLMRSATYVRAPLTQRLAAHSILAEVLADFPDKQLWHRAAATLGTDDAIATQLEHYAQRSRACGAIMAAVAALDRAAKLSERPERTTALLLHAAELASETGARREAIDLLDRADLSVLGPIELARLAAVEEMVAFHRYEDADRRIRQLVDIAAGVQDAGNTDLAAAVLWFAAARCSSQDASDESRKYIVAQLDSLDLPAHDPQALAIGAFSLPWERGAGILEQLDQLDPNRTDADAMRSLGYAALYLGDFRRGTAYVDNAAEISRSQGRLGLLSGLLGAGNWIRIWLGDWDRARAESEEARAFAAENGQEFYLVTGHANLAMIAALRGESELAAEHLRAIGASPLAAGMRCIQIAAQQTRGMLLLLAGQAEDAFTTLARVYDPADPVSHPMQRWWVAPELADAAVASENADAARELLADLPELVKRVPAAMLLVVDEYSRAVLADDTAADAAYTAALTGQTGKWPLYRARLQLHHGRRLRRLRRTSEAREPLREARDTFDALGAGPWAEAARNELRAAGETSARRSPTARDQLTAQELQIATLAAEGFTNRQIAEKLYLSHRTVGSHLYRIYPRLGISSRVELAGAISAIS
ncbi:AAA family ATPase [Nocardia suismassiliense]|uniref:AAA family ATPase n=1 Tax=Nocardia suismassiliense TaxID=2077092 RepID=UPI002277D574|nr:LuxR family transcriptional regulator [Nocardia suismassiliense]